MCLFRLPRRGQLIFFQVFFFLLLSSLLPAEEKAFHEYFLSRRTGTDAPLPIRFQDPSWFWEPLPLTHRRFYPMDSGASGSAHLSLPPFPFPPDPPVEVPPGPSVSSLLIPTARITSPGTSWGAGLSFDTREGGGFDGFTALGQRGRLGVSAFLPLKNSPRPWSAALWARRQGGGSGNIRLGVLGREPGDLLLAGDLQAVWTFWNGRNNYLHLRGVGLGDPAAAGAGGGILGFSLDPFLRSSWGLIFQGDWGGWLSGQGASANKGLAGRAALAGRWYSSRHRFQLAAGLDAAFSSEFLFQPLPWVDFLWGATPFWSLYARGGWSAGYPQALGRAFLEEKTQSWDGQVELTASYRLGSHWRSLRGDKWLLEASWRRGNIISADGSNRVVSQADHRVGGHLEILWALKPGTWMLEARGEVSLADRPLGLYAKTEFAWRGKNPDEHPGPRLFLLGGTQDFVLGAGVLGFRPSTPIIGTGAAVTPVPGLALEALFYADTQFSLWGIRFEAVYNLPRGGSLNDS